MVVAQALIPLLKRGLDPSASLKDILQMKYASLKDLVGHRNDKETHHQLPVLLITTCRLEEYGMGAHRKGGFGGALIVDGSLVR
jgi:hypothetical protein